MKKLIKLLNANIGQQVKVYQDVSKLYDGTIESFSPADEEILIHAYGKPRLLHFDNIDTAKMGKVCLRIQLKADTATHEDDQPEPDIVNPESPCTCPAGESTRLIFDELIATIRRMHCMGGDEIIDGESRLQALTHIKSVIRHVDGTISIGGFYGRLFGIEKEKMLTGPLKCVLSLISGSDLPIHIDDIRKELDGR